MTEAKPDTSQTRRPIGPGRAPKITDALMGAVSELDASGTDDKIIMRNLDIGRTTLWRVRQVLKNVSKT